MIKLSQVELKGILGIPVIISLISYLLSVLPLIFLLSYVQL